VAGLVGQEGRRDQSVGPHQDEVAGQLLEQGVQSAVGVCDTGPARAVSGRAVVENDVHLAADGQTST
jgi:hypothetical protein